jgi:polyhydroxybutyrate depolymerase
MMRAGSVATFVFFAGCSSSSESLSPAAATGDAAGDAPGKSPTGDALSDVAAPDGSVVSEGDSNDGPLGGSRPVSIHVPPGYVAGIPAPLIIMLHGYSVSGATEESYLTLTPLSDARGFLYAYPDGTVDASGLHFWNATDACCDVGNTMVDDSGYLSDLIKQIEARYTVDPKKVFLVGHSNGGFMAYRMACDHADQIVAIASLAGAMFADVTACGASAPVNVLQIHGTSDTVINYAGGSLQGHAYPGAKTTVEDWATIDGCATDPDTSAAPLDLDSSLPGNETTVTSYAVGCKPNGHAELWTIQGGSHIPSLSPGFAGDVVDFLFAHARQ